MSRIEDTLYCDGCGMELRAKPVIAGSRHYCCEDCRDGYECNCAQSTEYVEVEVIGPTQEVGPASTLGDV